MVAVSPRHQGLVAGIRGDRVPRIASLRGSSGQCCGVPGFSTGNNPLNDDDGVGAVRYNFSHQRCDCTRRLQENRILLFTDAAKIALPSKL